MDFLTYNKNFLQMQKDYFKLDDIIAKVRTLKTNAKKNENTSEIANKYEEYATNYSELKSKVYANALRLKEYFVENNEEFDESNFKVNLSFYHGYSIMESTRIFDKDDYKSLNVDHLNNYKQEINNIMLAKKEQYNAFDTLLKADKKLFSKEFGEDVQKSKIDDERAKSIKARYKKTLNQRENIYKKMQFIKKEIATIDQAVLEASKNL
jgi:hypothetical protein